MTAPVSPDDRREPAALRARSQFAALGPKLAALLLGAACTGWTAVPALRSGLAQTALFIAVVAVLAGALRLALADIPHPEDDYLQPGVVQAWLLFMGVLRVVAWEETAVVALIWLEAQHPARPWHTFALGAGLAAYLLVTHIAESGASARRVLRAQWKVLAVGACLLALGAGFGTLPLTGGAGAALLSVVSAVAVVAAATLVLPA